MRTLRSVLLLAAAAVLVPAAGLPAADAAPQVTPLADKGECWRGPLTRGDKKPVKVECCVDGNGDYPCSRIGDDDLVIEFSDGDCRRSRNGRTLSCSKGCGPKCTARFEGKRE